MIEIVCLSTSNYEPFPTRKQNVMNRLAARGDTEILYFDPPVTRLAPLRDAAAKERLTLYRQGGKRVREHLTVFALPPVLPFFNKFRCINRFNQRRQAKYIRRQMAAAGFEQPVLWCYSPTAADLLPHLPYRALVYDCVDRHSAYRGLIDPALVDHEERELATAADQVFCTAAGLYDTLAQYNPHTLLIPNGVDYDRFCQAADDRRPDPAHPVFGFVGMLQDCLEYRFLLALADAYPQGEIELIGRVMPGVDLTALKDKPNIVFTGLLPQEQLPQRMRRFDVCLNLFAPGKLSRDVSPLKFYEYLATGKPLVSTPEPLQVCDYR